MSRKLLTLVLIQKCNQILLGFKKRGFGASKWNGFGGKVNFNESIVDAAVREVKEECGLSVAIPDLRKLGIIDFEFSGNPEILEVHVFHVDKYEGTPIETEEMSPKWFYVDEIPFDCMWPDDKMWFPFVLTGKKFQGYFLFDNNEKILSHSLETVSVLRVP